MKVVDHPQGKPELLNLLSKYRHVIALPGETLGKTNLAEHHIALQPNTNPIYIPAYRLPHSQREMVDGMVQDMLDQGVIKHSSSPWNSPLFLVPKKDGRFRPVIDFRRVNEVTVPDRYPMLILSDIFHFQGKNNAVFSSLDLLSGYWQIPLNKNYGNNHLQHTHRPLQMVMCSIWIT